MGFFFLTYMLFLPVRPDMPGPLRAWRLSTSFTLSLFFLFFLELKVRQMVAAARVVPKERDSFTEISNSVHKRDAPRTLNRVPEPISQDIKCSSSTRELWVGLWKLAYPRLLPPTVAPKSLPHNRCPLLFVTHSDCLVVFGCAGC